MYSIQTKQGKILDLVAKEGHLGLYFEIIQYDTMILQRTRIILRDAGFEPGPRCLSTSILVSI